MRQSLFLVFSIILGLVLWMSSGLLTATQSTDKVKKIEESTATMRVQVKQFSAQPTTRTITVLGQLDPIRTLTLKAETEGKVEKLNVEKGARIKTGELLLKLAVNDRPAQLRRAQAAVKQHIKDVAAIKKLQNKQLHAKNKLLEAQALLAQAQADMTRVRLDIGYTKIYAPFSGVINERFVEQGSFVERANQVMTLVDDSTLLVSGDVSQYSIQHLKKGQQVEVALIDNRKVKGTLRYISAVADSDTHSFRIEVAVPNPNQEFIAGMSAILHIPTKTHQAHLVSPALLVLNEAGELGLKSVDEENNVHFHEISIIQTETKGVWVTGLPNDVTLITLGQSFVSAGEQVIPVTQAL